MEQKSGKAGDAEYVVFQFKHEELKLNYVSEETKKGMNKTKRKTCFQKCISMNKHKCPSGAGQFRKEKKKLPHLPNFCMFFHIMFNGIYIFFIYINNYFIFFYICFLFFLDFILFLNFT